MHTLLMPHGWCMTWNKWLIGLNVSTDALVALSYYSIPAALFYVVFRRKITFNLEPILILFGLFIALCGGGHLIDIIAIWKPIYWVKGFWNLGTAVASVITAIVLVPRTIDFIRMPEVNERLKKERSELKEESSLLRTVLDSIGDGIVLLDRNGDLLLRNPAAKQVIDLVGEVVLDLQTNQLADEDLWQSSNGRQIERFAAPVAGYGRLIVLRDRTERLEAEQARVRLERIIAGMKQGFSLVSLDSGRIIQTNESFDAMHAAGPAGMVGQFAWAIYAGTPEEQRDIFAAICEACENDGFWEGETRNARTDGTAFFAFSRFNLYAEDGRRFVSSIHVDISEQKRLEEEARRVELQLIESAKLESLGVLAGGVAHDFNNLLTGIIGNTSLAVEMIRGNSPVLPLLRSAVDASERAAGLTYQLLAYSGKGRFVIAPLNILELAEKISDLVLHSTPKAVELRIEPNPSLPAVQADASQIQQVIMNLVINGAEAIGERPGTVTLRGGTRHLSAEEIATDFQLFRIKPGEYVWLEVRDNGCGMDAATRKQIFEPFFTTKFTGRGLGLAAVLGIVRGHNGALCVESTKGVGSVFTVYLPVSKEEAAIQVENSFRADLSGSGLVLIVDDEDLVRATAVGALKHYGYEVVQAQDGWEALRQFDRHEGRFSLVILDVTMPVMSGEQTLLRLREKDPDVRVLLTSGYSETEAVKRFAGKGISGFLQKPYTSKTLAEKVRAYARRAQDSV